VHPFPGGEEDALFFIMYISLNIFVYLLFSLTIGFVAFSCYLLSFCRFNLVSLCRLNVPEVLLGTFLMKLFSVVSSPWKMLHLCIVNVSEVIIKTVFIKKEK